MRNLKIPTIVLLDSGIGGVAVLNRLIDNHIYANYIYIADNEFMPYGSKSKSTIRNRANVILKDISDKYNPDLIIIACNTMSTCIDNDCNDKVILMKFRKKSLYLATRLTQQNLVDYDVIADANLASLIEKHITNKSKIIKIINNHLRSKGLEGTKQLVLGCTHYELFEDVFKKYIGDVKCNSECMINQIRPKLKSFSTKTECNIVVETTKKSISTQLKIMRLIKKKF